MLAPWFSSDWPSQLLGLGGRGHRKGRLFVCFLGVGSAKTTVAGQLFVCLFGGGEWDDKWGQTIFLLGIIWEYGPLFPKPHMLDECPTVFEVASELTPQEDGLTGQRFSFLKIKLSISTCLCFK